MTSARPVLLVSLLLASTLLPATVATADAEPVDVVGPDADGVYTLRYDVTRAHAGVAALTLDVVRKDFDDATTTQRALDDHEFPVGTTRHVVTFLPAEGPGDYAVSLVVDGAMGAPLRFTVHDGDGDTARFTMTVADEPTLLWLTSDSVNADGRLKSPGEDVITRAVIEDGNGLDELDGVVVRVGRLMQDGAWALLEESWLDWTPQEGVVRANLEHRHARSPAAAGDHRVTLVAMKEGEATAEAQRTFRIREVASTLHAGKWPGVVVDEDTRVETTLVLADRNGFEEASGMLELRVFRASVRVEGDGIVATFVNGSAFARLDSGSDAGVHEGAALTGFPLSLDVPERAQAGTYRVSVYADGSLVGSLPFDILPLPRLQDVQVREDGGALRIQANGTGDGIVHLSLHRAAGGATSLSVPFVNGTATGLIHPPAGNGDLAWRVDLHARHDGPLLEARNGTWNDTQPGPALIVLPERVSARLPAVWRVDAAGWDVASSSAAMTLTRWDGAAAERLSAVFDQGRVVVDGPADLEPGRYTVDLTLTFANGTKATTTWDLEAGPWMRLSLGDTVLDGRSARIGVVNDGGLPISRLVVEVGAEGLGPNTLRQTHVEWQGADARTVTADFRNTRHVLGGLGWAPGEAGELHVRLPEGPLRSGEFDVRVRVLALPGGD